MKYLLTFLFLSLGTVQAVSQTKAPAAHPSTVTHEVTKADSAKLKAAFKELFPLIRPTPTVKERAEMNLKRMSRMFTMQGIDSAKAHDSVMAAINPNEDEVLLYNAYAENFSPDELKSLATFFKTPAGKHYLEVEQRLINGRQQVEQYINRTISMVTAPMRKPTERKPGAPGAPGMPPRMRPGMRPAPGQPPTAPEAPAPEPAPAPQH